MTTKAVLQALSLRTAFVIGIDVKGANSSRDGVGFH